MEGQGGREKVVGYSSFPQMGLYSGPRSQAVQVPQCAFISQQLDSQGLPRICAALQRLALVPGPLCASSPAQEQWAEGWVLPTNL